MKKLGALLALSVLLTFESLTCLAVTFQFADSDSPSTVTSNNAYESETNCYNAAEDDVCWFASQAADAIKPTIHGYDFEAGQDFKIRNVYTNAKVVVIDASYKSTHIEHFNKLEANDLTQEKFLKRLTKFSRDNLCTGPARNFIHDGVVARYIYSFVDMTHFTNIEITDCNGYPKK